VTAPAPRKTLSSPLVTVSRVIELPYSRELLLGAGLDLPMPGTPSEVYALIFEGWAVGRHSPAVGVEISGDEYPEQSLPVSVRRPDQRSLDPDIKWAINGGFRAGISSLLLPEEFDLRVEVRLEDGARTPLARVIGRRRPFVTADDHLLRPIMVNTLGRTGSTWVTALLGAHPDVVAFRPYAYEARVATYWAEILATLAEPQSYLQSIAGEVYGWDWWTGRGRMGPQEEMMRDPDVERYLGQENILQLAEFARERIAGFYAQVAGRPPESLAYFVEKTQPTSVAPAVLRQFYPGTKEVFLARDPRDVAASTIAYNRKRGFPQFGRELVSSDEEFIRGPLREGMESLLAAWRNRAADSYLMRYEDLIQWPRVVLKDVFEYVGIDSGDSVLDEVLENAERPQARELHQTSESVAASLDRWRTDLPGELRDAADDALGEIAVEFGYER
jgi:hypothetical protein